MSKRVFLLSAGRTCCHLLERILSQQPNTIYLSHPFTIVRPLQVKLLEEGRLLDTNANVQDIFMEVCEKGYADLTQFLAEADQKGKTAFIHKHPHFTLHPGVASDYIYADGGKTDRVWNVAEEPDNHYTNLTVLPDELYLQPNTVYILTTRNPTLTIPSSYRAMTQAEAIQGGKSTYRMSVSYRWQVMLYDWLQDHGVQPIVVDASDFATDIESSKKFMTLLCEKAGLDASSLIYNWPKASPEQVKALPKNVAAILKTILSSDGLIEGEATKQVSADGSVAAYQAEFGEEAGAFVKSLVEENMVLYEYFYERRLKLGE